MIERVHEHIITELQQNTRTDTIFILTAILLFKLRSDENWTGEPQMSQTVSS